MKKSIKVSSEVGRLRKLLIHRPDGVVGRIIPEKAEEWLYDDIVYRDKMRWEYYHYVLLLLVFLDKKKVDEDWAKGDKSVIRDFLNVPFHILVEDAEKKNRMYNFFNPNSIEGDDGYHNSDKVLDVMVLLRDLLKNNKQLKNTIVTAVCTLEGISDRKRVELLEMNAHELTKTLISGDEIIKDRTDNSRKYRTLFAPVPNLIFTRDIGVVANKHILISNAAKRARQRESLLVKYIFKYHTSFRGEATFNENVIELADDEVNLDRDLFHVQEAHGGKNHSEAPKVAVEGGDVMMVNEKYLLIGMSERTNEYTIKKIAQQVFDMNIGIEKIIATQIPKNRSSMHLDTIMTQVNTHDWVIYKPFIGDKATTIKVFTKHNYKKKSIEPVHKSICQVIEDEIYEANETVNFIPCGNGEFPHDRREQWTDGCNLLALMPGIAIGYDRNTITSTAFKKSGYEVLHAQAFIQHAIENNLSGDDFVGKKIILLLPSGELSRARGGSHCMSMPLVRDDIF
ncbi:MAG: arginine deiminase family protein [Saprospiraceae bacterium]